MPDAIDFSVTIANLPQVMAAFMKAPSIVGPIMQQAIDGAQALLAKHTNTSTVPHKTDNLIQSFGFRSGPLQASWGPNRQTPASYAIFVELGTKAHEIWPVNKQALYWPGADHPVKHVNHPGTKANPYMERIRDEATPDINQFFGGALAKAVQAIADQSNA